MVKFNITGKAKKARKEEIRAMLNATATVLEFHNKQLMHPGRPISVVFVDKKYLSGKTKTGSNVVGSARCKEQRIKIVSWMSFEQTFTALVHEMIHLYIRLDDDCIEKCTSTLTNRLKPDIAEIYDVLIDGVYERAAYLAHTKIAYIPDGFDYYDDDQYEKVGLSRFKSKQQKEEDQKAQYRKMLERKREFEGNQVEVA